MKTLIATIAAIIMSANVAYAAIPIDSEEAQDMKQLVVSQNYACDRLDSVHVIDRKGSYVFVSVNCYVDDYMYVYHRDTEETAWLMTCREWDRRLGVRCYYQGG